MSAIHLGMREAGEDREVVAKLLDRLEVRRQFVVLARPAPGTRFGVCRPSVVLMQIIRRGGWAAAAAHARGIIASSNGRASVTPAPRRKVRREIRSGSAHDRIHFSERVRWRQWRGRASAVRNRSSLLRQESRCTACVIAEADGLAGARRSRVSRSRSGRSARDGRAAAS